MHDIAHCAISGPGPIQAVLFDLSGTTLDESYLRHAMAAVADEISHRWQLAPEYVGGALMQAIRTKMKSYESRPFHCMSDAVRDSLAEVIGLAGGSASCAQVRRLESMMWRVGAEHASPAKGAVETLATLRQAGIRTGIVSYSDVAVFRVLLKRSGLAGLTDVELCSEEARSCKPHPSIFLQALAAIDIAPRHALFVGDSVDSDIVGGNRVGMRTALLPGREFNASGATTGSDATPDHLIAQLADVIAIVRASGETGMPNVAIG